MDHEQDDDGYTGPAEVSVGERTFILDVQLSGFFQPLDGFFHWYGRLAADEELSALIGTGKADAVLTTPHGQAPGQLGDPDLWHRYRIEGTSTPPFRVHRTLEEIEHVL